MCSERKNIVPLQSSSILASRLLAVAFANDYFGYIPWSIKVDSGYKNINFESVKTLTQQNQRSVVN